jgi:hypothetical protein
MAKSGVSAVVDVLLQTKCATEIRTAAGMTPRMNSTVQVCDFTAAVQVFKVLFASNNSCYNFVNMQAQAR